MFSILVFRICMVVIFVLAALGLGAWKNWKKYYPTVLFTMVVNLAASFLSYHHILWNYNPDALVKTQTTVEMINAFIMLPATTFVYLSKFPSSCRLYQYGYILLWVFIYGFLEYIDSELIGGLSYKNGWSWLVSVIFDVGMFSILRLHHLRPLCGWVVTFAVAALVLTVFNFGSAEMK